MSAAFKIFQRNLSTSSVCCGKKNFRKFLLYNKVGTRLFKERQKIKPHPAIPIDTRGVKEVGYKIGDRFVLIPERVPELIVPNLEGCTLKPYVSYRTTDIYQTEFTAKDLFKVVYAKKIRDDFHNNKLDENGNPLEPSENELLTAEDAKNRALKTGSDIFKEHVEIPSHSKKPNA